MKHILVVDDELGSRESLKAILARDHRVSLAASAAEALQCLSGEKVDLIFLDVIMPDKDGLTLLKEVQNLYPELPVIMVSASTSVRPVVEAIRAGAYDYVTKPFDVEDVRRLAERALESSLLRRRVEILQTEIWREYPVHGIVGKSPSFRKALDDIRRAADTDSTVLISGESGTGKELVARLLHSLSGRRDEPFVPVHCAALPESLMESELFGHEKGAFTHAEKRKLGRFDLAGSGTLFFDEVSEMSMATQVKLLRVLQEREYMRVGGTQVIRTNARIVGATAKDLHAEVNAKHFRDDLYYRLNVVPVVLPPLRDRPEDIPLLARHFLGFFKESLNASARDFAPKTMDLFCKYRWPGNVRELRNLIERMLVLHGHSELVQPEFLPDEVRSSSRASAGQGRLASLEESVNAFERQLVEDALREAGGVQTRAAELLGTTRRILRYRMEKLQIKGNGNGSNGDE
ncbi:MAG: sigma-54 dependent transcriptional regulator [Verrucomicrobiota bacterium]